MDEHENPANETEPARHIRVNIGNHTFFWKVLLNSKHIIKGKILECVPYGNNLVLLNTTLGVVTFIPDDSF